MKLVILGSGFRVHSPRSEVQRPNSNTQGRRPKTYPHLLADSGLLTAFSRARRGFLPRPAPSGLRWPGSRRRSGAEAGVARAGGLQRLSMRNVASTYQVVGECGAAEEGPSELLVQSSGFTVRGPKSNLRSGQRSSPPPPRRGGRSTPEAGETRASSPAVSHQLSAKSIRRIADC